MECEKDPLLMSYQKEDVESTIDSHHINAESKFGSQLTLLGGIALLFFIGSLIVIPFSPNSSKASINLSTERSSELRSNIINRYTARDGPAGSRLPWLQGNLLAEPYMPSQLQITDPSPDFEYEWELYDFSTGMLESTYSGSIADFSINELRDKELVLTEYSSTSDGKRSIVYQETNKVYVRYVRREIRALYDDDREELMDAMYLHWSVEQSLGEKLYGPKFQNAVTMLKYHLQGAANSECDRFHDGYGFLSQHSGLSLLFEQSLQAINPRLTLPYWDYIVDVEETYKNNGGDFTDFVNSALFTEDYFGETDRETYYIKNGRWANLKVPSTSSLSAEDMSDTPHNAYGLMRAPWSNNQDDHFKRASTLCGSQVGAIHNMATCYRLDLVLKNDFLEFMTAVSYAPHGSIHIALGGTFSCDEEFSKLADFGFTDEEVETFKGWSHHYQNKAWRYGYLDCSSTEIDGCTCPDFDEIQEDSTLRSNFLYQVASLSAESYTTEQQKALVTAVCTSGLVDGDNLQASSSYAPEFWPIHGTVERMYQVKRANNDFEDDMSWDSATWSDWPWQLSCEGHYMDSLVLMGMASLTIGNEEVQLTNSQYLELLDLSSSELPYIYDNINWDICKVEGFTFMEPNSGA